MNNVTVVGHSWGNFTAPIIRAKHAQPFDYILGADLFYDNSATFEDIIASVTYLIGDNANAKFVTTYHKRR